MTYWKEKLPHLMKNFHLYDYLIVLVYKGFHYLFFFLLYCVIYKGSGQTNPPPSRISICSGATERGCDPLCEKRLLWGKKIFRSEKSVFDHTRTDVVVIRDNI